MISILPLAFLIVHGEVLHLGHPSPIIQPSLGFASQNMKRRDLSGVLPGSRALFLFINKAQQLEHRIFIHIPTQLMPLLLQVIQWHHFLSEAALVLLVDNEGPGMVDFG